MPPKQLTPVTIATIPLPPYLDINDKRKGPFDAVKGVDCDSINQGFRMARANVTMIASSQVGDCYVNGTCTGLYELVRTGQVDYSMMALPVEFNPEFNMTSRYPVTVGERMNGNEITFMSLPHHPPYKVHSDILSTFEAIPWYFDLIQLAIFISILALLNASFVSRRSPKLKLAKRIAPIDLFAIYMGQLLRSFVQPHRFVSMVTLLIHSTLVTIIVLSNVGADMVAEFPAQYYLSIEDVIKNYPRNHRPMIMKGFEIESKFIHKSDPRFQLLGKVAQTVSPIGFPTIAEKLLDGSVLVEDRSNVQAIRSYLCINHLETVMDNSLRESVPFFRTARYILYRPNCPQKLQKKVSAVHYILEENGINRKFVINLLLALFATREEERSRYYRCNQRNSMVKRPQATYNRFSISHFNRPLVSLVSIYSLLVIVFYFESFYTSVFANVTRTVAKMKRRLVVKI